MLTKRIIPCLDVDDGYVVKGIRFQDIRKVGNAVKLGARYAQQGADELVFLDITATTERRQTLVSLVQKVAREIFIPFTVGGGIRKLKDMERLLKSGADKVAINTAAVKRPALIKEAAKSFGSQFVVLSIDAKKSGHQSWIVTTHGGRRKTNRDALDWALKAESLGAGEIMLNIIDADGTTQGYDLEATRQFSQRLKIPVIASGGAGNLNDIFQVLTKGKADAALAASIFHYGTYTVKQVKQYLKKRGVAIRI